MYGNNIQATKSYRMTIPLTNDGVTSIPGTKFYFPETPVLEQKTIVGIEGHVATEPFLVLQGDLNIAGNKQNISQFLASALFMTIYDEDGSEKFYNVPFKSLCLFDTLFTTTNKKRVYPFIGKIKIRKSYFTFPPNLPVALTPNFVVTLTFFYKQ
jgi:hypothetical protein